MYVRKVVHFFVWIIWNCIPEFNSFFTFQLQIRICQFYYSTEIFSFCPLFVILGCCVRTVSTILYKLDHGVLISYAMNIKWSFWHCSKNELKYLCISKRLEHNCYPCDKIMNKFGAINFIFVLFPPEFWHGCIFMEFSGICFPRYVSSDQI